MPPLPDSKTRFSSRVKDYIAYRPSYPAAVVHDLSQAFSISPNAVIADIGSGTGISAALLLRELQHLNVKVIGVEPNKEMCGAAEVLLADNIKEGRFVSVDGTAEATGLEGKSVDLVVAAQAFHWFDIPRARAECKRILKDNEKAGVALIWNDRRGVEGGMSKGGDDENFPQLDNPVMNAYDLLLVGASREYKVVNHHYSINANSLKSFFGPEGYETRCFENPYRLTFEELKGRLLSSSYTPQPGQEGHEEMVQDLQKLFEKYQTGGKLYFIYDTRVFFGRIS